MTREELRTDGFELFCYLTPEIREKAKAKFESLGYTCIYMTETIHIFSLHFLGIKIHKPSRVERHCWFKGDAGYAKD